jgi:hypothetical protein
MPKKMIRTSQGAAYFIRTEKEDKFGRWNADYWAKDGFWVIHEGKKHHVYMVKKLRKVI